MRISSSTNRPFMRHSDKKLITWLLALMMMFSPIQGVASVDLQSNEHGVPCAMSSSFNNVPETDKVDRQIADQTTGVKCEMNHAELCQSHPGCSAHISLSTIIGEPLRLFAPFSSILKPAVFDESVLTVYPSLPKRPPKA